LPAEKTKTRIILLNTPMARNLDPKCKQCRRAGEKLFLKGERCATQKCAFVRRPYAPGTKGGGRRRAPSEYGRQLAEKQKIKRIYGLLERQFKNYVLHSIQKQGDSRQNLMGEIERRLDNVIFRLGLAKSRESARQIVSHGLVKINDRRVNIPSYRVRPKDLIKLKPKASQSPLFANLSKILKKHPVPGWLKLDTDKLQATVLRQPQKEDLGDLAKLGTIIEFYSR